MDALQAQWSGPETFCIQAWRQPGVLRLVNQRNLLLLGATMNQLQNLAQREGVPSAQHVFPDIDQWNADNGDRLAGVSLVVDATNYQQLLANIAPAFMNFLQQKWSDLHSLSGETEVLTEPCANRGFRCIRVPLPTDCPSHFEQPAG